MMRSWLTAFSIGALVLLTGCTTTPPVVRSEVTAFHEWPATLQNARFAFEPGAEQQNNLEYRAYQSLIGDELQRLGFRPAETAAAADLKVRFRYAIEGRDVRIVEPVRADPVMMSPFYRPYWGYYSPFYDPYWPSGYWEQRETQYVLYTRRLHLTMAQATDGRNLFDVTVVSEGSRSSLAGVMPYLVKSAFADFPGPNGVPRRIELRMGEESRQIERVPEPAAE